MATSQVNREISVTSTLARDVLLFRGMQATEGLSSLSEYNLELYSERVDLNIDALLATHMTVTVNLRRGGQRYFSGLVTRFVVTGRSGRYATYKATLRPWLWFLTLNSNCRIFQNQSVPEILKSVFAKYSIADVDVSSLSGTYSPLNYCVQYRESDFNFVSRLLEQEGIYYYIKSSLNQHTLVLADSYSAHAPASGYAEIDYMPAAENASPDSEVIYDWQMGGEVQSGAFVLQDFDFEKPSANLLAKSVLSRGYGQSSYEHYEYPGKYKERRDGEAYARLRLEALHGGYRLVQGATRARGLFPGVLFTLTSHPRSDQNIQMLMVKATYVLSSDAYEPTPVREPTPVFTSEFIAMPSQQEFRPALVTRKPLITGPQTAIVVGKEGEEVWTDQYGRIKVQFHWDREGQGNETSSCWVRVAQIWAGKRWGTLFLPRIGQEVVVSFLEGDPDQPLVTGSVYNAECMPPYTLPEHALRSTMKSQSTAPGGGSNELRFDDKQGAEQVFLHAEKNLDQRIKQDSLDWVGRDRHSKVVGTLREQVGGDRHSSVGGDHYEKVDGGLSISSGRNMVFDSGMKFGVVADLDVHIKAGMNVVIEAGASITLKAGAAFMTIGPAIVASAIPLPLPQASAAANAMALAANTGPAGVPLTPKEADDGKSKS
ncbi:type VI secretion system Vgr family protein [Pseudomonas caspiana]|uniref:Type VI secretion protein ImpA n=1 Tax=Pseudomonas caspiana TaxID=1451454 RepID=A0A1Y3P4D7_9PSED|nr:type VI secretion system tip protein VgrG [Pseudomonas caspiana]OUM72423.1 type VI secretion protein ImpA [Pseudomonas caspiana]